MHSVTTEEIAGRISELGTQWTKSRLDKLVAVFDDEGSGVLNADQWANALGLLEGLIGVVGNLLEQPSSRRPILGVTSGGAKPVVYNAVPPAGLLLPFHGNFVEEFDRRSRALAASLAVDEAALPELAVLASSAGCALAHADLDNVAFLKNAGGLPKLTVLGEGAFKANEELTSCTVPEGIVEIGEEAFHDCAALEELSLPATVKLIGARAFLFCRSLKSVAIPSSVAEIGWRAFRGCSSLATVTVPASCTLGGDAFPSSTLVRRA